ncbi:hypothetical protein OE88DRAFT_1615359, partial [Heliocybe sulcata]
MPSLRILAGPDTSNLQDITALVNTGAPHPVASAAFAGSLAVYLKDVPGADGHAHDAAHAYFGSPERADKTWSIQARGRFLEPRSADDVVLGVVLDRPLSLPWGFGALLKLMKYIDPTLEEDLASSTKPWALSPLISAIPHLVHQPRSGSDTPFPPAAPLADDTHTLRLTSDSDSAGYDTAEKRRAFFRDPSNRQQVTFGPEDVLTLDFCHGHLEFEPRLALKLPGGKSVDLTAYWDGQPVRFVCCERGKGGIADGDGEKWGRVFWCVVIEPEETPD